MIVLAGGIGAGKSVVARIIRLEGYGVFDCDYEARVLMETDSFLVREIKAIAGEDIYVDGRLDRKALASALFADDSLRGRINSLVHAAVRRRIGEWLSVTPVNIFVETAIAAQSGIAGQADAIWLVDAPVEERLKRVRSRDGRPEKEILKIMEIQAREETTLIELGKPVLRIRNGSRDNLLDQIREKLQISKLK